jgi:4-hydroxy-3-polyprenylbenzoate decarboxylase
MEKDKEVLHVKDNVSTRFQISYVMKRFDNEGPILLFENVKDYDAKIVANVSGTRKRICSALNVDQNSLYRRLAEVWRSPVKPKIVKNAAAKE